MMFSLFEFGLNLSSSSFKKENHGQLMKIDLHYYHSHNDTI